MSAITERARAKINLTLRVLGRRADGYHLLESLIVFAGVGDERGVRAGRRAGRRDVRALRVGHRRRQSRRHGPRGARRRRSDPDARPRQHRQAAAHRRRHRRRLGRCRGRAARRAPHQSRPTASIGSGWPPRSAPTFRCASPTALAGVGRRRARRAGRRPAAPRCRARLPAKRRAVRQDQIGVRRLAVAEAATADAARAAARRSPMRRRSSTICAASATTCARPPTPCCPTAPTAEAALAAAARLPLRQPLRRRSDELWDFSRCSARRCGRRAHCARSHPDWWIVATTLGD